MNAKALAKSYPLLTAEERFRLIAAASARGDGDERDRLVSTGPRVALSVSDHAPLLLAFHELALLVYIEMTEMAALYAESDLAAGEALHDSHSSRESEGEADTSEDGAAVPPSGEDANGRLPWQRLLDLARAWGYILRTKAAGWELFCARLGVPPFGLWQRLPGFDRLRLALNLTAELAYSPDEFLRWLNRTCKPGEPERTKVPFTVAGVAAGTEAAFREHVRWRGGGCSGEPNGGREKGQ